jgi:hypothetical protein
MVPGPLTVEATGATGAAVDFDVTATDLVTPVTPKCDRTSGSMFALEMTTVTCSVTDAAGNTASRSFTVTVRDTTTPRVTVPGDISVNATMPAGAVVVFGATAFDIVGGQIAPTCAPASGSTFAVGTTTVTCTATDPSGNTGSASFTVSVASAETITDNLLDAVAATNFQQGAGLLQAALRKVQGGDTATACNQLGAFLNQVHAQTGKKLTTAEAAALTQSATDARGALACK